MIEQDKESKPVQRAIGFRFKETSSRENVDVVVNSLRELKDQIREIRSLDGGINISKEGRNKGITHLFVLKFASMADLQSYAHHPAHEAFVRVLLPHLADSIELDSHLI